MNAQVRRNKLEEYILGMDMGDVLFADGFDDAIIGLCECWDGNEKVWRVAYDRDACIDILIIHDNLSREEAGEFFEFKVMGTYMGKHTPVFIEVSQ